jgi:polysaccharide export outer membrane protein
MNFARGLRRTAPLLCAILLGFASCAPGGDLRPLPAEPPSAYHLVTGDGVRLITFGSEQLSGEFKVNDSGKVAVPLVGDVPAAGLTTDELQQEIDQALIDKKLMSNPSVSVQVTSYGQIYILGEVARPGAYPFVPGMTVLTAVSVAGGFTYRAVKDYASIVRTQGDAAQEWKAERQTLVKPGDVITIFENRY